MTQSFSVGIVEIRYFFGVESEAGFGVLGGVGVRAA